MKRIKDLMLTAMVLSILFLISYICHHLLAGDTRFGDINHDGIVTERKKRRRFNKNYLLYHTWYAYSVGRYYSSFYFIYGLPCFDRRIPGA